MTIVHKLVTLPELFSEARYGLTSVVQWQSTDDPHWRGGIQYDADCTEVSLTLMECISGAPGEPPVKTATWSRLTRGSVPFTPYTRVDCTPDINWWETGQARALRALRNSVPTQLERTLWTGDGGISDPAVVYPNLTATGPVYAESSSEQILLQPASTIITGAADIVEGLGLLEEALGDCYDGVGVIHAPVVLGPTLFHHDLCYIDGTVLRTYKGNLVVLGLGYDSDYGPGGVAPSAGSTWMFATSPIFGYRDTPRVFGRTESLDRAVNTYEVIAEQTHILGWECCLAGVLVAIGA